MSLTAGVIVGLLACGQPESSPVDSAAPVAVPPPDLGPVELVIELPRDQRAGLPERARAAVEAELRNRRAPPVDEITVELSCQGDRCSAIVRAEPG